MTRPGALIFDLNGTMIDDMEFHTIAWTTILNDDLKAGLTRDEVRRQMYGKNEEVAAITPKGVEAALKAGMKCVVLTTMHSREEFREFSNVVGFVADYMDPLLEHLIQ